MFFDTGKFNPRTMQSRFDPNPIVVEAPAPETDDDDDDEPEMEGMTQTQQLLLMKKKREAKEAKRRSDEIARQLAIQKELARRQEERKSCGTDFGALAEQELQRIEKGERRRRKILERKAIEEKKKTSGRYSDKGNVWSSNKCDKRFYTGYTTKYYGDGQYTRADRIRELFPPKNATPPLAYDADENEERRRMDPTHYTNRTCKPTGNRTRSSKSKQHTEGDSHSGEVDLTATVVTSGSTGKQWTVDFATVGGEHAGIGPKAFSCGSTQKAYQFQLRQQERRAREEQERLAREAKVLATGGAKEALSLQLRRLRSRMDGAMAEDVSSQSLVLQRGVEKTLDTALAQMLGHKNAADAHAHVRIQAEMDSSKSAGDGVVAQSQKEAGGDGVSRGMQSKKRGNGKIKAKCKRGVLLPDRKLLDLEPRLWSTRTADLAGEVRARQVKQQQRKRRQQQLGIHRQAIKQGW